MQVLNRMGLVRMSEYTQLGAQHQVAVNQLDELRKENARLKRENSSMEEQLKNCHLTCIQQGERMSVMSHEITVANAVIASKDRLIEAYRTLTSTFCENLKELM